MKLFTTAIAALAATTVAASAMTGSALVKVEVEALGIDSSFVETLSEAEFLHLKNALSAGSDSDIRQAVTAIAN